MVGKGGQKELTERQKEVYLCIEENPAVTRKELMDKLNINGSAVQKLIEALKTKEVIRRVGGDKGGYWEVIKRGVVKRGR